MTTSTLIPQPERETRTPKSSFPKLPYRLALALWFVLPDGSVHCVGQCSSSKLYDFVELVTPTWTGHAQSRLMDALDFDDELGRWHIVNTLRERLSRVPLFTSAHEAHATYTLMRWLSSLAIPLQGQFCKDLCLTD